MILLWKSFKIDLKGFKEWLDNNIPNSDGIVASEENFTVVEKEPLTGQDIDLIEDYYASLTEEIESIKLNRPFELGSKIASIKESAINKPFKDLTILERKILFNVALTGEEEEEVLNG